MDVLIDNRGGSVSVFTDEMLEALKHTALNKLPKDFGFLSSIRHNHMLSKHISDRCGKECYYE